MNMKNYIVPEIKLVSITTKDVISNSYVVAEGPDKCVTVAGFGWGAALGKENLDMGDGFLAE